MEYIVAVAIRIPMQRFYLGIQGEGPMLPYPEFLTVSAPPPFRHHHLMHPLYDLTDKKARTGPDNQGFLTNRGRFVGREEALQIALASGQPLIDHPSRHATQLFSEDLW